MEEHSTLSDSNPDGAGWALTDTEELDKLLNGEQENTISDGETDADAVPEVRYAAEEQQ